MAFPPGASKSAIAAYLAANGTLVSNMTDVWTGGIAYDAIKMNVTDTSSLAASNLIRLQVGGADQFVVTKASRAGATNVSADSFDMYYNGNGVAATAGQRKGGWSYTGFNAGSTFMGLSPDGADSGNPISADVRVNRVAAGIALLTGASITTPGAWQFYTYAASPPAAPAASQARLYADTSGGKIRIMALFPSGAAQLVASEP